MAPMTANVISLSDFAPAPEQAPPQVIAQVLADAIAQGRVTVVIGDLDAMRGAAVTTAQASEPLASDAALTREDEIWTFTYGGRRTHVSDCKGVRYLAFLLESPGVEIHALDLVAAEEGHPAEQAARRCTESNGPLLDAQAKAAYRARLQDLREELEEAERFHDPERATIARDEIDFIEGQLTGAIGLGGRDRTFASSAERARVNVTRAIRSVIKRLAKYDAGLGQELETTVRTGTFFAHEPDPRSPVSWSVDRG